jgi:hypothetical protein
MRLTTVRRIARSISPLGLWIVVSSALSVVCVLIIKTQRSHRVPHDRPEQADLTTVVPDTPSLLLPSLGVRPYSLVVSVLENDALREQAWKTVHPNVNFHRSARGDVYPPYPKNMRLWKFLQRDTSSLFYVRCDSDTVIDQHHLSLLIESWDSSESIYAGKIGSGRPHERERLGLATAAFPNFVMGGMCEIVSALALRSVDFETCDQLTTNKIGPYFPKSPLHHSDVELGRCFAHHHIHARDTRPYVSLALEAHSVTSTAKITGERLCAVNKVRSKRSDILVMHSVKDPMTWLLASQTRHRSIFTKHTDCSCSHSPVMTFVDTSCGNPFRMNMDDKCGVWLPPCHFYLPRDQNIAIEAVHVVGLSSHKRLRDLPPLLVHDEDVMVHAHDGVDKHFLRPSQTLTIGEIAVLRVMRNVLTFGLESDVEAFLVLEDDFLVHKQFNARYKALSAESCFQDILHNDGIFMAGFTMWNERGWGAIEQEMKESACVNAHRSITGAFANVYTRRAAHAVVEWIDINANTFPFDHAYGALIDAGIPVRGAWKPLFVADVSHVSTVNAGDPRKHDVAMRHKVHRWGPRDQYNWHL